AAEHPVAGPVLLLSPTTRGARGLGGSGARELGGSGAREFGGSGVREFGGSRGTWNAGTRRGTRHPGTRFRSCEFEPAAESRKPKAVSRKLEAGSRQEAQREWSNDAHFTTGVWP